MRRVLADLHAAGVLGLDTLDAWSYDNTDVTKDKVRAVPSHGTPCWATCSVCRHVQLRSAGASARYSAQGRHGGGQKACTRTNSCGADRWRP